MKSSTSVFPGPAPAPPVELAAFDAAIPMAAVEAACREAATWNAQVLARPPDAGPARRKPVRGEPKDGLDFQPKPQS